MSFDQGAGQPPSGRPVMLARQRQGVILDVVRERGAIRIVDLVAMFGVSDMTIRRDLEVLAERGLIEKVHGGATAVGKGAENPGSTEEPGFEAKSVRERVEKEAISRRAARFVSPGTAIGLSAGTTTWLLAQQLCDLPGLTVATNSIQVADVLHRVARPDQTVVITGGIRTRSDALVGPLAVNALRALHLDVVFIGVHGMDVRAGFTTPNLMEAETNRALVDAARRLVVVADHTKWGMVGLSSFARLDEADVLVTDDGLAEAAREQLADRVGELVLARVTRPPARKSP